MNSVATTYNYNKKQMAEFEIEQIVSDKKDYAFVCGDSLEILKTIPNETVNCVVTSPCPR